MKLEHDTTAASDSQHRLAEVEQQAPIALLGLFAIGLIVAVNYLARPDPSLGNGVLDAPGCRQCGTVVAVRRSAHSVPVTLVEVQMADGSLRTVRGPGEGFSVGDVVEVRGGALTPHPVF